MTTSAMLVVALSAAACGAPEPAAPPRDLDQIVDQGTVRICSTGDYRPFTFRDSSGQWSGSDIEMAHDLAQRLGVKMDLIRTTWGSMMSDLGTRCDVAMGGVTVTLDRAKQALYSTPYLRDGKAAIVRCADRSRYQNLAQIDQAGVRVVVNPSGTNADFDKANLHQATIVTYPDNNTIFDEVAAGSADVMITDASEVRWVAKQNPQLCGASTDNPFTFEQKAYLIPRGYDVFQQWVDQWLQIAENDGTYAAISHRWFG